MESCRAREQPKRRARDVTLRKGCPLEQGRELRRKYPVVESCVRERTASGFGNGVVAVLPHSSFHPLNTFWGAYYTGGKMHPSPHAQFRFCLVWICHQEKCTGADSPTFFKGENRLRMKDERWAMSLQSRRPSSRFPLLDNALYRKCSLAKTTLKGTIREIGQIWIHPCITQIHTN